MHLLLICAAYQPDIKGGGEISTALLAEAMVRRGHRVTVLTAAQTKRQEIVNGVAINRIPSPNIYWNFNTNPSGLKNIVWHMQENWNPAGQALITKYLRKLSPDLVVTSTTENFGTTAWQAAYKAGIPVAHILRSYNSMCVRATMFRDGENCLKPCARCNVFSVGKRLASHHLNGVIGLSRQVLDTHLRNGYFPRAKAEVLPNFISGLTRVSSARHMGTPATFGYFGMMSEQKGLGQLIDSFKAIAADTGASLVIAGPGDENYIAGLKESLQGYRATFLGWTKQQDILPKLDFLVVPSIWHEPFGRVILEAFSYAVPVIGSNRGGIPDIIRHGQSGYVFEPADEKALSEVLRMAASDTEHYDALSQGALNTLGDYSESAIMLRYENYFLSLIAENRKAA